MMTDHTDLLEQSFEINLNNYGPEDVQRLNDWAINAYAALEALQAEIERLTHIIQGLWMERDVMCAERDAALAEIEKQEPIYQYQRADGGWIDQTKNGYDYNVRYGAATVRILYAAAGASPVEPSESAEHWHSLYIKKCQELHDEKARLGAEIETLELAAIDDAERYAVPPSQTQPPAPGEAAAWGQDLLEIMCARIKAADDAMADGNYMLDSDDCISVIRGTWKPPMLNDKPAAPIPQPPAQCDTAITYMTGYSDSKEWAAAPIPQQPSVPEGWKQAVALAYGHLWHVNNEPMAPIPLRSSETAAYEARKQLRDLLTHEERGLAINRVQAMLSAAPQPKDMK